MNHDSVCTITQHVHSRLWKQLLIFHNPCAITRWWESDGLTVFLSVAHLPCSLRAFDAWSPALAGPMFWYLHSCAEKQCTMTLHRSVSTSVCTKQPCTGTFSCAGCRTCRLHICPSMFPIITSFCPSQSCSQQDSKCHLRVLRAATPRRSLALALHLLHHLQSSVRPRRRDGIYRPRRGPSSRLWKLLRSILLRSQEDVANLVCM